MPSGLLGSKVGVDLTLIDDVRKHELGSTYYGADGRKYTYVKASAAIALGDACKVDFATGKYNVNPTSAVAQVVLGIAQVAVAINLFFWLVTGGEVVGKLTAATAAGVRLGSSGVAGTLITLTATTPTTAEVIAAIAQAAGTGAMCRVAESGGLGTVFLGV